MQKITLSYRIRQYRAECEATENILPMLAPWEICSIKVQERTRGSGASVRGAQKKGAKGGGMYDLDTPAVGTSPASSIKFPEPPPPPDANTGGMISTHVCALKVITCFIVN